MAYSFDRIVLRENFQFNGQWSRYFKCSGFSATVWCVFRQHLRFAVFVDAFFSVLVWLNWPFRRMVWTFAKIFLSFFLPAPRRIEPWTCVEENRWREKIRIKARLTSIAISNSNNSINGQKKRDANAEITIPKHKMNTIFMKITRYIDL